MPDLEPAGAELEFIDHLKNGHSSYWVPSGPSYANERKNWPIRAKVLRNILLGLHTESFRPPGIILHGACIDGKLDLRGAVMQTGLFLVNCQIPEVMTLCDAEVPHFALSGSTIAGLDADGIRIHAGLKAEKMICTGSIRLIGGEIGGQASFVGARILGGTEPAFIADGVTISGDLLLRDGFCAEGGRGALRLPGAMIKGNLDCVDSTITGSSGAALNAERIEIHGNLLLRNCVASAEGVEGGRGSSGVATLLLRDAEIRGQLSCEESVITGRSVPAVSANGLRVTGDVFLSGLTADGDGDNGVVRLLGAHVGGHLVCDEGRVTPHAENGLAVDLRFATVGKAVNLSDGFIDKERSARIRLDGLTYPAVPEGMKRSDWIGFLRKRMPEYAAQPYRQLASVYHAAGHDEDARAVLIAQHDHLAASGLRRRERWRLRMFRLTLGYGYQTWRALIGLLATLVTAVVVVLTAAQSTHAVRVPPPPTAQATVPAKPLQVRSCAFVDQIGLSIDLVLPLINTTARSRCNVIASTPWEQPIVAVAWLLQILGWGFATLVVAGYTGLIRKE